MPENSTSLTPPPPNHHHTDLFIIGAGPIGIELACECARAGIDYTTTDAGPIGATLVWWAPGTTFFSSPERLELSGVPLVVENQQKATREQYLAYLRQVAGNFGVQPRTYEPVVNIDHLSPQHAADLGAPEARFLVRSQPRNASPDNHRLTTCKSIALTIGDMHRPRFLNIPGEQPPHVSHYLADPHVYANRNVLIVGGKNSAVEAAIRLYRVGANVTIAYRKPNFDDNRVKYWLLPELNWLISKDKIGFLPETTPTRIDHNSVTLEPCDHTGAPIKNAKPTTINPDDVLLLTGYEQDPWLFEHLGVTLQGEQRAPTHDRSTMQTNIEGVYVAGTASAGTQIGGVKVFIETSHIHVERIIASITGHPWKIAGGRGAPTATEHDELPES